MLLRPGCRITWPRKALVLVKIGFKSVLKGQPWGGHLFQRGGFQATSKKIANIPDMDRDTDVFRARLW